MHGEYNMKIILAIAPALFFVFQAKPVLAFDISALEEIFVKVQGGGNVPDVRVITRVLTTDNNRIEHACSIKISKCVELTTFRSGASDGLGWYNNDGSLKEEKGYHLTVTSGSYATTVPAAPLGRIARLDLAFFKVAPRSDDNKIGHSGFKVSHIDSAPGVFTVHGVSRIDFLGNKATLNIQSFSYLSRGGPTGDPSKVSARFNVPFEKVNGSSGCPVWNQNGLVVGAVQDGDGFIHLNGTKDLMEKRMREWESEAASEIDQRKLSSLQSSIKTYRKFVEIFENPASENFCAGAPKVATDSKVKQTDSVKGTGKGKGKGRGPV